jgi:uncharacterized protein YoxC
VSSAVEWSPLILAVGVGAGVLLIGVGVLFACVRLGELLTRAGKTLDEVDGQISALSGPIAQTLVHVGGIADTADTSLAKLAGAVESLEVVADNVGKTSSVARDAIAPSLVNVGAALAGVTAGLRKLVSGDGGGA